MPEIPGGLWCSEDLSGMRSLLTGKQYLDSGTRVIKFQMSFKKIGQKYGEE
jgi:hypothetical protein